MDIPISDLLDTLREVDLDLPPTVRVPGDRIEELTMKKLHKYEKKKRRGLSFVTKVLVAAIIAASLAIPVMAAGGFTFKDWLIGPEREQTPETVPEKVQLDLMVGSESGSLVASSNYYLTAQAEDVTSTGLTYLCEELCTGIPAGTLTTTDGYWLEKWNGNQFVPMEGKYEGTAQILIEDDGSYRWEINWEDVYGALDTGAYHLGKVYAHTTPEGETTDYTVYVYFRIYTGEMGTYVAQANAALEELAGRHSYHLTKTDCLTQSTQWDAIITELWKYGDNYLRETRYVKEDGTLIDRRGSLRRDGVGYKLDWSGDSVTSEVSFWERADYLIPRNFTNWDGLLSISDGRLGQVYVEENSLFFYEYCDWKDENELTPEQREQMDKNNPTWNHDYTEVAYHLDEAGAITEITHSYLRSLDPQTADPFVDIIVEVHDTDPEEIAGIINMQDVSRPNVFSWEADRTGHYTKLAQFEGFVNTAPISAITSAQDAIERAKAEAIPEDNPKYRDGYNYNMTNVWYDPDAGIWKVRFYHSQDPYFQAIVWMNDHGITQMKSLSSYEEFN